MIQNAVHDDVRRDVEHRLDGSLQGVLDEALLADVDQDQVEPAIVRSSAISCFLPMCGVREFTWLNARG